MLAEGSLVAPHLVPVEVTNILRRIEPDGRLTADAASLAHADLQAVAVELFPYAHFADQVWELRTTVTSDDAWYVAVAGSLDVGLATLDGRLSRATGPRCELDLPPS